MLAIVVDTNCLTHICRWAVSWSRSCRTRIWVVAVVCAGLPYTLAPRHVLKFTALFTNQTICTVTVIVTIAFTSTQRESTGWATIVAYKPKIGGMRSSIANIQTFIRFMPYASWYFFVVSTLKALKTILWIVTVSHKVNGQNEAMKRTTIET